MKIVHRDIKPANISCDARGNSVVRAAAAPAAASRRLPAPPTRVPWLGFPSQVSDLGLAIAAHWSEPPGKVKGRAGTVRARARPPPPPAAAG